jgi:two-component system NtrC family sensor kinase
MRHWRARLGVLGAKSADHGELCGQVSRILSGLLIAEPVAVVGLNLRGEVALWNPEAERLFGWKEKELLGRPLPLVPEEKREQYRKLQRRLKRGDSIAALETTRLSKSGAAVEVSVSAEPLRDGKGKLIGSVGFLCDLTSRKRAEQATRLGAERLRMLIDNSMDLVVVSDVKGNLEYYNPVATRSLGYGAEELIGQSMFKLVHPDDLPAARKAVGEALASPKVVRSVECRLRRKDGAWRLFEVSGRFLPGGGGQGDIVIYARDVTERRRVEGEVRKLSSVVEQSPVMVLLTDAQGAIEYANPAFLRVTGYSSGEVLGKNPRFLKSGETSPALYETLWETIAAGLEWRGELQNKKKDGETLWVSASISPLRGDGGSITHYMGLQLDITESKLLRAEFQQAQKMECVGRLAGGVAHDFNNLLTAIMGYGEMLLGSTPPDDPRRKDVEEILATGKRATELTRQLLTFSRQQTIAPRAVSLNALVLLMDNILRRLIGADIELVMLAEAARDAIKVDPGQLEQVVVNLAVNARDAMPGGGKLILETANAELDADFVSRHPGAARGPHVMLAVSDTGCGMSEEVRSRLFEPFFTTKERGKGTGLGLTTCYGIVKQNGGSILVYSEPGHGSTFKIFFPAAPERVEERALPPSAPPPRGSETVLLAEDEPSIRNMIIRTLQKLGYRVLAAYTGEEALRLVRERRPSRIDLLLTDVVMPRMGGIELAKQLGKSRPGLKMLFTSGYTDGSISRGGLLPKGAAFLSKPFSSAGLALKVREVLDG